MTKVSNAVSISVVAASGAPAYFPTADYQVVVVPASVNLKNNFSSVTPSAWNPGSVGAISDNVIAHYSGGTGDGTKIWVNGGGHTDCAYNGLHQFDFSGTSAPAGWTLLNAPSSTGAVRIDNATYTDGLPSSVHTYGGQCIVNGRYFRCGGSIYNSGSDPGYFWLHNGTSWVRLADFPNGSFGGALIALQPNASFPQGKILACDRFGVTQQGYAFFTPNSTYTGGTWGSLKSVANGNWTYDPYASHQPLTTTTSKGLMVGGDGNWSFDIDWSAETCTNKTSRTGIPTAGRGGILYWDSQGNTWWFMASNTLNAIYSIDPTTFAATSHTLSAPITIPDTGGGEYGHWGRSVLMTYGTNRYIGLVTGRNNNAFVVKLPSTSSSKPSFSTTFTGANEAPISEGGRFIHNAAIWQKVNRTNGHAVPAGFVIDPNFDDCYAILTGFETNPDYEVTATIYKGTSGSGETEILLRCADTGSTMRCYECLFNIGGGIAIVRWQGAINQFQYMATSPVYDPVNFFTIQTGDRVRARIIGNVINFYWLDRTTGAETLMISATDNGQYGGPPYTTGNPGIGFFQRSGGSATLDYGFDAYSVTGL